MLPARDRITVLTVFSTKADAKADTNGTSYSEGIVSGTGRLERTFYSALPAFGECNAAMFECELGINADLTGKWIRVVTQAYATEAATTRTTYKLFLGKVDSCEYDARQATRKLIAYDEMYSLRNTDISAWWNTYFAGQESNVGIGTVLGDMMAAFDVTGTAASTIGDTYIIITSAQKKQLFSGCSFAQVLSHIGTALKLSFYIDADGGLKVCSYSSVNKTNTPVALDSNVDTVKSLFGDDENSEFSNVVVYEGTEAEYSDGSNPPTYSINDNPILKGRTTSQYSVICSTHLSTAKKMSGLRSAEIALIASSPDVVLLRPVAVSYNGVTYMASGIELSGTQLIEQTIHCTNNMAETPYYASTVTEKSLADGAVSSGKIADGAVDTAKLAALAVTEGKIAASAVTSGKIASLAVDNAKLAANAVTEGKLAANAVTEGKIAANAVVAAKIASNAVTTDKLDALAVTAAKLAAGAVTANKIDTNAVTADKINAGAVTSTKIDAGAVVAEKIASGAVSTDKLAALAVTAAKIASGAITTDKLNAGAVTADKISVTDLSAIQGATIAGWSLDSSRIYKEVTIDGYVYQVVLNAPATPTVGNWAVGVRKRPVDSQTWSYPCYFNYGGTLTANDAVVRGTVVASDFTANGKVRIAPDYDLQEAGVYALELVDQFDQSTVMNPDFANIAIFPDGSGVHIDTSYVSVRNSSGSTDTTVELENLGAGSTGLRVAEGDIGQAGYKESYLGADQLVVNGKDIFADNAKIKQTVTTTSADYPVLFGATAITQNTQASTVTDESRISGGIFINPNTATINARRIHTGTTSQYGRIVLGNNIPNGTAGCSHGEMYIYCKGSTYVRIADVDGVINANRTYRLPNQSGYLMVDAVTTGTPTSTSNVSYDSVTWTKVGKTVRLSGTFYFATSTSAGTLFTGLPTPASEMTIIVAAHDNIDWGIETLKINTSGEIVFGGVGTHLVDTGIQFVFDTTYISAS